MDSLNIDINVDVGEGLNNEASILPFVSSCNIACGGHAGDVKTMQDVVRLAKEYNVKIGAHPSYPDRKNFGRKPMKISNMNLTQSITEQINSLLVVVHGENAKMHHVKPHGALYNKAMTDKEVAMAIILAVKSIGLPLKLYVPYRSVIADEAKKQGIPIVYEAFADRYYNDDLSLVSRQEGSALITNSGRMFDHVYRMIKQKKVRTLSGIELDIEADTYCIHGDNPEAVNLVKGLKENLELNHVNVV
jgi:UPF0271 protein